MPVPADEAKQRTLRFLIKQQQYVYEQRARYSDATSKKGREKHRHYDNEYDRYETLIQEVK